MSLGVGLDLGIIQVFEPSLVSKDVQALVILLLG